MNTIIQEEEQDDLNRQSFYYLAVAEGYKDGKNHKKRKFYEIDRIRRKFKRYMEAEVLGYLTGYKLGSNKKEHS